MSPNHHVQSSTQSAQRPVSAGDGGRLLADAISWNVLFSGASGVWLLLGSAIGPWFGLDPWLQAGVGANLVIFAVLLFVLLTVPRHLRSGARWVIAADAAWVAGAVTLLSAWPSELTLAGRTALTVTTAVVALLALAQLVALRRARGGQTTGSSALNLEVRRTIAAPRERVWDAVADVGGYARFAPGIAETAVEGHAEEMVRHCTDDLGGGWSETCTLWEEGHRYRMTPDVSTYPIYYRALIHELAMTWTVEPASVGTLLVMNIGGQMKLGLFGRIAARLLASRRRLGAIPEAYERELTGEYGQSDASF